MTDSPFDPPVPPDNSAPVDAPMPDPNPSAPDAPKWWKQKKFGIPVWVSLVVAVVVVLGVIGAVTKKDKAAETSDTTATETTVATAETEATEAAATTDAPTTTEATTTLPPTTTTTIPTTTTTPPPPIVLEGSGDQVIPINQIIDTPHVIIASNDGSSNFIVYGLDADLNELDLLVNEIGPVSSRGLVEASDPISFLDVSANGSWRLEFVQLDVAIATGVIAPWDGAAPLTGTGNDLSLYTGDPAILKYSNTGDSNFIIYGYSGDGTDLLVNDIGPIEGSGRIGQGPVLLDVQAGGGWTLTVTPV